MSEYSTITAEDVSAARAAEQAAIKRCGTTRTTHRTLRQFLNHAVEKVRAETVKPDDIVSYLRSSNWTVEPIWVKVTKVTDKTIIGDVLSVDDYTIGTPSSNEGPKTARISKGSYFHLDILPAERLPELAAEVEFWKPYWEAVIEARREVSRKQALFYRRRRDAEQEASRRNDAERRAMRILASRHPDEFASLLEAALS